MSELPARETGMTLCFSHCSLRDELQDLGVDLVLLEVDRRDAVLLREEVRDLVVADVAELRERVAEVLARALLLVLRLPELRERDQLLADEELAEPVLVRHHPPISVHLLIDVRMRVNSTSKNGSGSAGVCGLGQMLATIP